MSVKDLFFDVFMEVVGIEPTSKKFTEPHLQAYPSCKVSRPFTQPGAVPRR